jgi:FMN phosphatase YigB (HAD superfamily)
MAIKAVVFDCYGVLYNDSIGTYNQPLVAIARALHTHYKTGVLSNMSGAGLRARIQQGNMADAFDAVVASGDTNSMKPHREIFEYIAAKLGVALPEILFFDDLIDHVQGAQAHGMQAVHYRSMQDVTDALDAHHLNYL